MDPRQQQKTDGRLTDGRMTEWPPSIQPCNRAVLPNAVAILLLSEEGLKFFKLGFYSVISFTDYPYTLTIVDKDSRLESKKFYRAMQMNHGVDIVSAIPDDLLLAQAFIDARIKYAVLIHSDCVVEPLWLSRMVGRMENQARNGIVITGSGDDGVCFMIRRECWEAMSLPNGSGDGSCDEVEKITKRAIVFGWNVIVDPDIYTHHFGVCTKGCDEIKGKGENHVESGR